MNCNEVREIIQLYLDSELDPRSTLSVLRHLERCSGCSRLLAGDLRRDASLKEAARYEAVDGRRVRHEIVSAIRREAARSRYRWLLLQCWRYVAVPGASDPRSIYRKS